MSVWLGFIPVLMTALLAAQGWQIKQTVQHGKDIAVVKKEVLPNSGTSLRDALHRVEIDVAVLKDRAHTTVK